MDDRVTTQLVHTGHLVHTDLRGIQRFVFASAQLRDVVGRSAMVRHVADPHHGPLATTVAETGVQVVSAAGGRCVVCARTSRLRVGSPPATAADCCGCVVTLIR